ncbi:hypothetical protein LSTR_LSTR001473 [Laodelphax striatellus]|uniref:phytanoyl-CoA dioxygenase n=1 Tax=Laodelphax striatellus TaxID=195883 RepID=A0A482XB30_LAOST|nr:hypothetical protein LSTR_LSTR001473 [Laodelphax striatellus]
MSHNRLKVIMRHIMPWKTDIKSTFTSSSSKEAENPFDLSINSKKLLSIEQQVFYEENGFLVIRKLIDEDTLEKCRNHFVDLCEGRYPKGSMVLMKDISLAKLGKSGEYLYNKVQDIVWDEVFETYILHNILLDYVESFIGPNIKAVHSMLINKPPDPRTLTSRHPLHQDLYYFPFRPTNKIVAAWTAMEPITSENGCLLVLPGSHKGPLLEHGYPEWENGVNKAYHGVKGFDEHNAIPLHMDVGDTVFFHPLLVHGSGPNLTKGFRKAISCHYASSDCYYIEVKDTIQDSIAKEIEDMAKKRGFSGSFKDIWQVRSRLVRGKENTL